MSHDGRQIWPALAIMGVGILALAVTLKAAQADMPMQPTWIMGALAGLYLVLALLAEGFHWRSLVLLAAMALAHVFTALLMGWGYAAVEGNARALIPALQFGFACLVGIALDVRLEPGVEDAEEEPEEPEAEPAPGPDLSGAADLPAVLAAAVACVGVAAALVAADTVQAAGVWAGDPQAAWRRVQAMVARGGTGLHSLPLGEVSLLIRSEDGRTAAVLVTAELDQPGAHDILRQLWNAG